ncbi:MAG TPA: hypothetical protein VMR45_01430 [Patescibacteria group bacterium]|nr:hypothetical protein [Patescibacteria group bacterium]
MHGLIREEHSFGANPGTKDLARHMYTRTSLGKVVIVADKPLSVQISLRRQWLKLARKAQKERASTLNGERILELTKMIGHMQSLRFAAKWPQYEHLADVYLATPEQLLKWAPECRTLYVTCDIELEDLHVITALMPKESLVVRCNLS